MKLINKTYIKKIVKQALQEDLSPHGDITSILINNKKCFANIIANQNGILSGLDFCKNTFKTIDRKAIFIKKFKDGDRITKGDTVAIIKAKAKSILTAERTALNFLGHASGISTTTNLFVQKVKKKSKICCTRKTSPNLRLLEKYAVKRGGGINHRFNLSDEIMIKDNHIKLEKSLRSLIKKAIKRKKIITVEIDKVFQLKEILGLKFKRILFDNMSIKTLKTCLKLCKNKYETEYSGNVNLGNIKKISNTRVNRISIGSLTHSSKSFDFTLDLIN